MCGYKPRSGNGYAWMNNAIWRALLITDCLLIVYMHTDMTVVYIVAHNR